MLQPKTKYAFGETRIRGPRIKSPLLYHLSYERKVRADNGSRTHNNLLGGQELYQLSYIRILANLHEIESRHKTNRSPNCTKPGG